MKAYLRFDLDDQFEREDHALMLKAKDYRSAIEDFTHYLRMLYKSDRVTVKVEEVREKFFEILRENDI